MYEILKKTVWSDVEPRITEFELNAPEIAKAHKAGQFVIIINGETGERIPLTIADKDAGKGTISILFQEVGASTIALGAMKEGDRLDHVAGPLGKPTHVEKFGTVVCVGGGVGIAPVHPIAKAMKEAGNHVISILGARTKDLLIYEENMNKASDKVCITTDDGSYCKKGFVTDELKRLIEVDKMQIDLVVVIGPPIMMKFVCKVTEPHKIKTFASLNTIMVDGTGMCGACRVTVGGKTQFVCVDGPEFDGHQVDYDEMMARQRQYLPEEKIAVDICKKKMCHSA
jgi:ferredoxin--NADP+ reductase